MKKIGIIVGSNRPGRRSKQVADWLQEQLAKSNRVQFEEIDLAAINLPFLDETEIPARRQYSHQHTKAWSALIQSYDGFVFVFPQYNWGYPAVLKNAVDYLAKEWAGKHVSLVTFGGHGGAQAQLAMRLVVGGLHMQQMAVNLQINLMPDDSTAEAAQKLERYTDDAQLLKLEFEKKLVD